MEGELIMKNVEKKVNVEVTPTEVVGEVPAELAQPAQTEEPNVASYKEAVVDGCKALNIRKAADKKGEVVTVVAAGTLVHIVEDLGEWAKVEIPTPNGECCIEGYAMKNFIKED